MCKLLPSCTRPHLNLLTCGHKYRWLMCTGMHTLKNNLNYTDFLCMHAGRGKKVKKRRENVVNTKCLQASRQAGGWRLLLEAICYALAIIFSFHLSSYISLHPFSLALFSLFLCLSAWSLYLSNPFRVCVTAVACMNACVCRCVRGCGW